MATVHTKQKSDRLYIKISNSKRPFCAENKHTKCTPLGAELSRQTHYCWGCVAASKCPCLGCNKPIQAHP